MLNYLKQYALHHLFYLIVIAIGIGAGRLWLAEHDLRVSAEQQIKVSETTVKGLQDQILQTQKQAAIDVAAVQSKVVYVKTPAQAVAAIPDLSGVDLHPRVLPDNPLQIGVDAVPLVQELAACKINKINLDTCSIEKSKDEQIISAKDDEIKALKKKPTFWASLKSHSKTAIIGIVIWEGAKIALAGRL